MNTWPGPEPSIDVLGLQVRGLKYVVIRVEAPQYAYLTSQPWKLQSLPLVQTPSDLYLLMMSSTILFSYWSTSCHWCSQWEARFNKHSLTSSAVSLTPTSGLSMEMRSMHMLRQMLRASSQPTCKQRWHCQDTIYSINGIKTEKRLKIDFKSTNEKWLELLNENIFLMSLTLLSSNLSEMVLTNCDHW